MIIHFFYRMVKGDLNGILMWVQYIYGVWRKTWTITFICSPLLGTPLVLECLPSTAFFEKLIIIYINLCAKLLWCRCSQVSRNSDTKSFTATASSPSWLKHKKGCEELYIKVLSVCYFSRARASFTVQNAEILDDFRPYVTWMWHDYTWLTYDWHDFITSTVPPPAIF